MEDERLTQKEESSTVHDNLLVGPNAVERRRKKRIMPSKNSIDTVFAKQKMTAKALSERDIITYFTSVRAANL